MSGRPKITLLAPGATLEEAAAVVAALERFMRETAPAPACGPAPPKPSPQSPWQRVALLEGVARGPAPISGAWTSASGTWGG